MAVRRRRQQGLTCVVNKDAIAGTIEVARETDGGWVQIHGDGVLVAANKRAALVVGPISNELPVLNRFKIDNQGLGGDVVGLTTETALALERMVKRSKEFGVVMEHAALRGDGRGKVEAESHDGKRPARMTLPVREGRRVDTRVLLGRASGTGSVWRGALNRKRILGLIEAMCKACPDKSGEVPLYVELFADGRVIMRTVNRETGQWCVGLTAAYRVEDERWEGRQEWEKYYCGGGGGGGCGVSVESSEERLLG